MMCYYLKILSRVAQNEYYEAVQRRPLMVYVWKKKIQTHSIAKEFFFCFGSSYIKEPLIGIYKHILLHFIYFLTT